VYRQGMMWLASLCSIALFVTTALATWQQGGGTAFTVGSPGSVPGTFDPNDPNNNGGDNGFKTGFDPQTGACNVSFSYNGCCTAPPACPGNKVPGVKVQWTAQISTPGAGVRTVSGGKTCCPAQCCPVSVTVTEGAPGAWGGPATGCSVTATVDCVCCDGDGSEVVDSPDWPDYEYGPLVLTLMP
jgi:hypothetical protein